MITLFSLLIILQTIIAEEKFNIFKSYADSNIKPPQYSRVKTHLRHSIDEYLDPTQKKMYKLRYSKDTPNVMFDSKWSGFDLKNNKKTAIL